MKKLFQLLITCKHNRPNDITVTSDGESVCKCGVVLEEKMFDDSLVTQNSVIPLYHQVENGCDPKDMKVVNKKIHIYSSSASEFSNICSKLKLSNSIQQRAWKIYHLLRSKTYYTRAKCATFSIYVACRESSQAIDEMQIQEAVQSVLCVKNTPSMLSVISEIHDDALHLGINTNEGHSSSYYLNLAISRKQHLFADSRDYDRFKVRVMNNFSCLHGNHQNRARRAVDIALDEMGVN